MRRLFMVVSLWGAVGCGGGAEAPAPAKPAEAPAQPVKAPPKPPDTPSEPAASASAASPLRDPASVDQQAPETFSVEMTLSTGTIVVDVTRAWAPRGADRFYSLVKAGFFDDVGIFRVVPGFVVQFGLHGDPAVNTAWRGARIPDDPVTQSNTRGTLVFATSGPNTRTTQLFINLADNRNLDGMGFAPFGVVRDMGPVDKITPEYGQKPNQGKITNNGNAYLKREFPNLDYVVKAAIVAP